jgi:integrase
MGQHLMRRPPKYVHGFIDRHGRPRFYFRRAGFKKIPLPGLPWSPAFMEAYETALAGQPLQIGSARTRPGTVRALAVSYFNSPDFRSLRPSSQAIYRGIIDRFCTQYGDNRIANLKREHVVKLMAARAQRPVAANNLRKVLRAMMRHAVEIGLRADDPTRDVRAIRVKSDGFHSWNDDEIAQFEKRHPIGSLGRLALALLLNTGQRRSDVVRMGPQHIRDGVLGVRQQKTGIELAIPVHSTLAAVIAETPTYHLTFLTNRFGRRPP